MIIYRWASSLAPKEVSAAVLFIVHGFVYYYMCPVDVCCCIAEIKSTPGSCSVRSGSIIIHGYSNIDPETGSHPVTLRASRDCSLCNIQRKRPRTSRRISWPSLLGRRDVVPSHQKHDHNRLRACWHVRLPQILIHFFYSHLQLLQSSPECPYLTSRRR